MSETTNRCDNEACPRPAEPGKKFCEGCGLERSLYRRNGGRETDGLETLRRGAEAQR